jgi:GT2 family glycosyltransferase
VASISVAVVNYNVREHLRACLASAIAEVPSEIVVVDNASSDGSVEMIRTEFPGIVLLANSINCGYGAAANQAVTACSAPYVLLVNGDTVIHPGTLSTLSIYLDRHPHAAIAGPRLLHADGTPQASCFPFPTPFNVFLEVFNLNTVIRSLLFIRDRYLRAWRHDDPRIVPWALGAALGIRREAFEAVGGFDESFFMYSEEIDLCYRLCGVGWRTHFVPNATITHIGGASTVQQRAQMAVRALRSTIDFYHRHYSRRQLREVKLILATAMLAKLARDILRWCITREITRQRRLAEDIRVWWHVLVNPSKD